MHEVVVPAQYDSLGNVTAAQWSYKGVDYVSLIPYLIGAVKELSAQNAAIQQQLAACCTSPNDDGTRSSTGGAADEGSITPAQARLLRIVPNPFSEPPTVQFTLERAGRMQLIANSADGKHISFIADAPREAGQYEENWNTNALQPGMYYITLLLDGEPLVKRAVKVGR
ncbi:MAG TPA: hypothetical protein PKY96_12030 [Flavobacteriales bacterium]|nr:hypothetical protein [Flavobacteriales bacterium]